MLFTNVNSLELIARQYKANLDMLTKQVRLSGQPMRKVDDAYVRGLRDGLCQAVAYMKMEQEWEDTHKPVKAMYDYDGKAILEDVLKRMEEDKI